MTDTNRRTFIAQTAGAIAAVAIAPDIIAAAPRRRGRASRVALIGAGRLNTHRKPSGR